MTTRSDIDDDLRSRQAAGLAGRAARLVLVVSVLVTAACGHADPAWPQLVPAEPRSGPAYVPVGSYPGTVARSIPASAPAWLDERSLGLLLDDSFHPLANSQIQVRIGTYPDTNLDNDCDEFDSAQAFRATVSIGGGFDIGPLSAGVGFSESDYEAQYRRFIHCRYFHHDRTVEVQSDIDLSTIPSSARYIITKIEFGWGIELIAENVGSMTQKDFVVGAKIGFPYIAKMGVSDTTSRSVSDNSIRWRQRMRGIRARRGMVPPPVIVDATTASAYEEAETPVAVHVEYRQLCGPRGCISPGRYRISDFPVRFSELDANNKPWDSNGSGLDLVLSLYVDDQPVGTRCNHDDIVENRYNCASDLRNVVLDLRDKSAQIKFHAIDDDDDGPYVPGHHSDDIGWGRLNFVVGNRSGVPLAFRTDGGVESASITLEPL